MKSQVGVRGFNRRRSPVVAVARFVPDTWETHLDFESRVERFPGRNVVMVPDLLMQDPYDGRTDPKLGFLDVLYTCITDAQRLTLVRLERLGIGGVSMTACIDAQRLDYSFLSISAEDRSPTAIELAGVSYIVDPVELAAAGVVSVVQASRSAQIESLMQ